MDTPVTEAVPRHVGIIMDGNGRWAAARCQPLMSGHLAGAENIRGLLGRAVERGVEYLSLYAFSTENWARPRDEVQDLMLLLEEFIDSELMALHREGVRIRHLGDADALSVPLKHRIDAAVHLTRANSRLTLAVAFNYGGRADIVAAVRAVVAEGVPAEKVDEALLAERLSTRGMPDPDLIIRTGGEWRLSNFMVWQAAYSELWATPVLWPDFGPEDFDMALAEYARRDRRFGGRGQPPAVLPPASYVLSQRRASKNAGP